jgi:hypothetical protein
VNGAEKTTQFTGVGAADAGIKTRIGNHTFRATGITAYLKNPNSKLYDRRQDEISLDEVEKISIWSPTSGAHPAHASAPNRTTVLISA